MTFDLEALAQAWNGLPGAPVPVEKVAGLDLHEDSVFYNWSGVHLARPDSHYRAYGGKRWFVGEDETGPFIEQVADRRDFDVLVAYEQRHPEKGPGTLTLRYPVPFPAGWAWPSRTATGCDSSTRGSGAGGCCSSAGRWGTSSS